MTEIFIAEVATAINQELSPNSDCKHDWQLEEPHGTPFLTGHCQKCPAVRDDFPASFETVVAVQGISRERVGFDQPKWNELNGFTFN